MFKGLAEGKGKSGIELDAGGGIFFLRLSSLNFVLAGGASGRAERHVVLQAFFFFKSYSS